MAPIYNQRRRSICCTLKKSLLFPATNIKQEIVTYWLTATCDCQSKVPDRKRKGAFMKTRRFVTSKSVYPLHRVCGDCDSNRKFTHLIPGNCFDNFTICAYVKCYMRVYMFSLEYTSSVLFYFEPSWDFWHPCRWTIPVTGKARLWGLGLYMKNFSLSHPSRYVRKAKSHNVERKKSLG